MKLKLRSLRMPMVAVGFASTSALAVGACRAVFEKMWSFGLVGRTHSRPENVFHGHKSALYAVGRDRAKRCSGSVIPLL